MKTVIWSVENNLSPAHYSIEVVHEPELDQHMITVYILDKRFSRVEKTRVKAVLYAQQMNRDLESAFKFTWEDNS